MNISILTTSKEHPVNSYLVKWIKMNKGNHQISLLHSVGDLSKGDILFLISCSEIVSRQVRDRFQKTLLVHASDLPNGRGWNPHVWEIIGGASDTTSRLIEAEDSLDTGNN